MARILEDDDNVEYPRMNQVPDGGLGAEIPSAETVGETRLERAKRLAEDPDYPSGTIVQTLADMLARHWYS